MTTFAAARHPYHDRGTLMVVMGSLMLSPGALLIRMIEEASDWQLVFYRSSFLALGGFVVLAVRRRGETFAAFRQIGWLGWLAGAALGGGFVCYVISVRYTTVANAVFLFSTAPFMAAALGWLALRERVSAVTWLAMSCAVAGTGAMVYEGLGDGRLLGNAIGLLTALSFAIAVVVWRIGRQVDQTPAVCIAGLTAAATSALASLGELGVSVHDFGLCAVMGALQVNAGFFLITAGARYLPGAQLTLLALIEVVLAPVWAWLALGEVPALVTMAGGAVVLGAIVFQALAEARRPPLSVAAMDAPRGRS